MQIVSTQENVSMMNSRELLEIINQTRLESGESQVRANDFNARIADELEGDNYESFVVDNLNRTSSVLYNLSKDQCMLVSMRESKKVRRNVLQKIKDLSKPTNPIEQLNNPEWLRSALLNYSEQVISLSQEVKTLNQAIDTITSGASDIKFQQASKILGVTQSVLAAWLREHKWDRYLNKSRASTAYSEERGYCWTKYEQKTGVKPSGAEYEFTQIEFFIKPKGMAILTKEFQG